MSVEMKGLDFSSIKYAYGADNWILIAWSKVEADNNDTQYYLIGLKCLGIEKTIINIF